MSSAQKKSDDSVNENQEVELSPKELALVRWEELALSLEEHYHAIELWNKRPDGFPMGHNR